MIKFLSESTINRIAAGEVIERPFSVIKELVENSIDAGSNKIDIIVEKAGKNLIIIADNGCGIRKDELSVAVKRHTTSKLDENDLLNINSFGFRGEALPSIAAISRMSITSRHQDSDKAYQLNIIGGEEQPLKAAAHNIGTKIEVRDLFFATPARLKFLRTERSEYTAILDIVKKIALAHPHISFSLRHDTKEVLNIKPADSLDKRIAAIIGNNFIKNAETVNVTVPDININGYIGIPTFNKATSEEQFLFINNRPIKDKIINMALRVAYQDYLARDRYPVAALFLKINPQLIDVNVHPAKNEVRFHDPNLVRSLLITSVKEALYNASKRVSTTHAATALGYFNRNSSTFQVSDTSNNSSYAVREKNTMNNTSNRFSYTNSLGSNPILDNPTSALSNSAFPKIKNINQLQSSWLKDIPPHSSTSSSLSQEESNKLFVGSDNEKYNNPPFPLGSAKAQIYNTYIISQTQNSMIIVDQHAAHERIGYEKIKAIIAENGLIRQKLLIPEIIEIPDEKRAHLLQQNANNLIVLGLIFEMAGEKEVIVNEIPHIIAGCNIKQLILDIADHLLELGDNIALSELIEHITETYACHYSIRAGRKLSIDEMNTLLRQMESTPFSGQCNHGRPTYIELQKQDIEKLFGRR